jgi:taurine dehydrogenase small subunit
MSEPGNILERLLDAYNRHDADAVASFFTEDAVFVAPAGPGPDGKHFVGREEIRAATAARFEVSPDVHWEPESHIVTPTRGASSWIVSWTASDGSSVEKRGCDLFDIRGDELSRKDSFFKDVP